MIKWRDAIDSFRTLDEDVAAFRRFGIPLSWVLIDNPWERDGCNGSLRFDPSLGNAKATVERLHREGLKVMVWVSPLVSRACAPLGYESSALLPAGDQSWLIDLASPAARTLFRDG